ncbi:MAG: hypothetical protein RLZZ84_1145 [Pseudomonadota bacterium]|jgi:hypothetical protein
MKKIALAAIAAAALGTTPAYAQNVTGTINLTGSVEAKCVVLPDSLGTFTDTVNFGELAQANGTLRTGLETQFGTRSFSVKCNGAAPQISVNADPLQTTAPADAGYDNSIDYQAAVALDTLTPTAPFTNDSSAAAGALTPVSSRLVNNLQNVHIATSNYRTNALTDLLVASPSYTGKITVVIAPN